AEAFVVVNPLAPRPQAQALAGVPKWVQPRATKPGVSPEADLWAMIAAVVVMVVGSRQRVSSSRGCNGGCNCNCGGSIMRQFLGVISSVGFSYICGSSFFCGSSTQKEDIQ
ncbi:Hypothetical predicted protein, partial [Marmota monax]